jgi:hypothetical protein
MKAGELLGELLTKAGVDVTNEKLKPILSSSLEIDDEFASEIQSKLMTMEGAKSKVEIKNHFVRQFTQGLDQDVKEFVEAGGYTDILEKMAPIKSTGERIKLVLAEIAAISKNKDPKDEDAKAALKALKEQNALLNTQLAKEKQDRETDKTTLLNEFDQKLVNTSVLAKFNSLPWSESIHEAARPILAKQFLDQALGDYKAKITKDENGNLQLIGVETQSPVFDSKNNPVTLDGLIKDIMTANKFIKVAGGNEGGGTQHNQRFIPPAGGDGGTPQPKRILSDIDKSLADQGIL